MTNGKWSKLCTLSSLRMRQGKWLIDVEDHTSSKPKIQTVTIGKRLSWETLSKKVPSACFNKAIKSILTEGGGVTFVEIHSKISRPTSKSRGYVHRIPFKDEKGYPLINVDTGKHLSDDLFER